MVLSNSIVCLTITALMANVGLVSQAAAETPICPVENPLICEPKKFIQAPAKFKARFETDLGYFVLEV